MRVEDKIAIVTGGAGGLGAATASVLAREGATVIVTDLSEESGEAVAKVIGGEFVKHDVSKSEDWERVAAHVLDRHGRIDVLAHAAGIEGDQSGVNMSVEAWNRVISINLTGSFLGLKAVYPAMLEQGTGSAILISSIASRIATSGGVAYGASKAGVEHLARSFAAIGWQGGKKVRCNSVHPGSIRTRMTERIFDEMAQTSGVSRKEFDAQFNQKLPLGGQGEPDDVADLMLYLASDESKYVTGTAVLVDGGWSIVDANG